MSEAKQIRIEVEAAKALARWKALLADEVCQHAQRLASAAGQPNCVTLAHYRQAAQLAIQALSAEIQKEEVRNARQEVA